MNPYRPKNQINPDTDLDREKSASQYTFDTPDSEFAVTEAEVREAMDILNKLLPLDEEDKAE